MTSAPLLGTEYVVATSTSPSSSSTRVTPQVCDSISQFKRLVRDSRQLDDHITTRLNRPSPDPASGCDQVWHLVRERWRERNNALSYCDRVLSSSSSSSSSSRGVRLSEETGLSAEKGALGRGRSTQQEIKINQLHQEFAIERIIRQRTLDLLASRCPNLSTSTSTSTSNDDDSVVTVPVAIGERDEANERQRRRGRDDRGGVRWA